MLARREALEIADAIEGRTGLEWAEIEGELHISQFEGDLPFPSNGEVLDVLRTVRECDNTIRDHDELVR